MSIVAAHDLVELGKVQSACHAAFVFQLLGMQGINELPQGIARLAGHERLQIMQSQPLHCGVPGGVGVCVMGIKCRAAVLPHVRRPR